MKTLFCLSIFFALNINPVVGQTDTSEIFKSVETLPEPEGGWTAFYQFLGKEIKYPQADREAGIEGKVIVQFVVEKDGTLSAIRLYPGTETAGTAGMREESLRVIGLSPKWKPGTQGGKNVRVQYQIPIQFRLSQPETKEDRKWWQRKK